MYVLYGVTAEYRNILTCNECVIYHVYIYIIYGFKVLEEYIFLKKKKKKSGQKIIKINDNNSKTL